MKVQTSQERDIITLADWAELFSSPRRKRQWRKGRSAYSLADFIMKNSGASRMESVLGEVLGCRVDLETAVPEFRAAFDGFPGNVSNLDLGVQGSTGRDASLFVGVEAKVDETFGNTVDREYQGGLRKRDNGASTNLPERVENLVTRFGAGDLRSMLDRFGPVRYQLLTGDRRSPGCG